MDETFGIIVRDGIEADADERGAAPRILREHFHRALAVQAERKRRKRRQARIADATWAGPGAGGHSSLTPFPGDTHRLFPSAIDGDLHVRDVPGARQQRARSRQDPVPSAAASTRANAVSDSLTVPMRRQRRMPSRSMRYDAGTPNAKYSD